VSNPPVLSHHEYRIMFRLAYDNALAKVSSFDQRLRYYSELPTVTLPHPGYMRGIHSAIDVMADAERHIQQDIKHCREWLERYSNIARWLEQFLATVRDADDEAWIEGIREYLNRSKK